MVTWVIVELTSPKGDHIPHEKEYNTRHGISAIPNEVRGEIRRQPRQSEIQQEPVVHLLLEAALGRKCGGNFRYTQTGIKDCSGCLVPHRRENYGQPMENIMTALRDIALQNEDCELVYPVHLSPVVRENAQKFLAGTPRVHLIDPLSADEMHNLMARCYMVMTDSGGLQEEAPALGKPVLVMRKETERPEAVAAGTVKLCGVEYDDVLRMGNELLRSREAYDAMAHAVNPYGDGHACARIADAILWHFGRRSERPADFNA